MESNRNFKLERTFSQLGKLQQKMQLQYEMVVKQNEIEFCIRKIQQEQECQYKSIRGITLLQGEQILQFLYENAVPFESWQDVLQELVAIV